MYVQTLIAVDDLHCGENEIKKYLNTSFTIFGYFLVTKSSNFNCFEHKNSERIWDLTGSLSSISEKMSSERERDSRDLFYILVYLFGLKKRYFT